MATRMATREELDSLIKAADKAIEDSEKIIALCNLKLENFQELAITAINMAISSGDSATANKIRGLIDAVNTK